MEQTRNSKLFISGFAALTLSIVLTIQPTYAADTKPPPATLHVKKSATVLSVLHDHINEHLYIQTKSGKEISGKLKLIGTNVIHIASVTGRDYYDAVIDIDSIESVMVRVRGKK